MVRRWAWLAVPVVGIALFEIVRRVLVETQNPNLPPSLILIGAAVSPARAARPNQVRGGV